MTDIAAQNARRLNQIVRDYTMRGYWTKLVQFIGLSNSDRDYVPGQDDGEPPHGAKWE